MKVLLVFSVLVAQLWAYEGPTMALSPATIAAAEIIAAIIQCPAGYETYGNTECIKKLPAAETMDAHLACQFGYTLTANGRCAPENQVRCPPGYLFNGQTCVYNYNNAVTPNYNEIPALVSCPIGFSLVNGVHCVRRSAEIQRERIAGTYGCPLGYTPFNGAQCRRELTAGPNGEPPAPIINRPGGNIIEITRNQTVTLLNTIDIPINITNLNNHTMFVGHYGENHTTFVRQYPENQFSVKNVTIAGNNTIAVMKPKNETQPEKCCEVVSPRICQMKDEKSWRCFHRRVEQCGKMCTAPVIYLRRPDVGYGGGGQMVIPPNGSYSQDCSMCSHGECPNYCGTHDCEFTNACKYVDQSDYCSEFSGRGCTRDFGCVDEEHCA